MKRIKFAVVVFYVMLMMIACNLKGEQELP